MHIYHSRVSDNPSFFRIETRLLRKKILIRALLELFVPLFMSMRSKNLTKKLQKRKLYIASKNILNYFLSRISKEG